MQKGIRLTAPDDLNDLMGRLNVLYIVAIVGGVIWGITEGGEEAFSLAFGRALVLAFFAFGIKLVIAKTMIQRFRIMKFWLPKELSMEEIYSQSIELLRPRNIFVTLQDGELEFQHDSISYAFSYGKEEGTFELAWYFSVGKALFGNRPIKDYKTVRRDTGLIVYAIQNMQKWMEKK